MNLRDLINWRFGISILAYGRASFWLQCRTMLVFFSSNCPILQDLYFVSGRQVVNLGALSNRRLGICLIPCGRANFWLLCRTGLVFLYSNVPILQGLCSVSGSQVMYLGALSNWCLDISLIPCGRVNLWLHCRIWSVFVYSNGPIMEENGEYVIARFHTRNCCMFFCTFELLHADQT